MTIKHPDDEFNSELFRNMAVKGYRL